MITSYDRISRFNHWIMAIAIIGMLSVGLLLEFGSLEQAQKGSLRNLHKATGVMVLIFALWRVGWRMKQGFPPRAAAMPVWKERLATLSHYAMLTGIIVMPISGLIKSLFAGRAIDVYGLFVIPAPEKIAWLASLGGQVHTWAGYTLAILVLVHITAALTHHLVHRDPTLKRMITGKTD